MTKRGWVTLATILLLLIAGGAWAVWHFARDTRFEELAALRDKLFDPTLTADERQAIREEIQRTTESLQPEVQKQAMDSGAIAMKFFTAHMKKVLALPDKERMAAIDWDIDNMQAMMQMFRGGRRGGQQGDAKGDSKNGDRPGDKPSDPNANQNAGGSGTNASGGNGGRQFGFGGGGPPRTDAQRTNWRNQMLSSVPADTRATFQITGRYFRPEPPSAVSLCPAGGRGDVGRCIQRQCRF